MSNIEAFMTTKAGTAPQQAAGGKNGAQALSALPGTGVSFVDMIFAQTLQAQTLPTAEITAAADSAVLKHKNALVTSSPLFTTNTQTLSAAQLAMNAAAAVTAGINTGESAIKTPELPAANGVGETVELSSEEQIHAAMARLAVEIQAAINMDAEQSGETTAGQSASVLPSDPLSLNEVLASFIQNLLQGQPAETGADGDEAQLIAANVTPAELAKLSEKLKNGEIAAEELLTGLVKLMPPQVKAAINADADLKAEIEAIAAEIATEIMADNGADKDDTAAGIAAPIVTQQTGPAPQQKKPEQNQSTRVNPLVPPAAGNAANDEITFDGKLTAATQHAADAKGGYTPNATAADAKSGHNADTKISAGLSSFAQAMGSAAANQNGLLNGAGWDSIYPDGLDWTQMPGGTTHPSLSLTGNAQFASLIAHGNHAAQPHPTTQMVAASLTKAAAQGESKAFTLKLDPPEMGRIEVRMEFNKADKAMKAHVIIEKPETYMMMQRDAQTLERSLQDAGINTDGGLSFELAQDGNLFGDGQDGQNRGGGGSGGKNDGDEFAGEEIIETTMTWRVDAETGHTHYNILA